MEMHSQTLGNTCSHYTSYRLSVPEFVSYPACERVEEFMGTVALWLAMWVLQFSATGKNHSLRFVLQPLLKYSSENMAHATIEGL